MAFLSRAAIRLRTTLLLWIDSYSADPNAAHAIAADATPEEVERAKADSERLDWLRCVPFILVHLACFSVLWVGWSWTAVAVAVGLYLLRMHAITGWYHRYFSHRSFKTTRVWQFVWAFIGNSSAQRGPLWWAANHRHHHRHSDEEVDIHSPMRRGFWWSHMGWFLARANFRTRLELVPDLAKYRELVWLDRFDLVAPLALGTACWLAGAALERWAPGLGVTSWQMLVWFLISTVVTAHATFTINSLAHVFGSRRFATTDTSRNSLLLALLTLGEGWHNNHHHYQATARQGFRWFEIDVTWYLLQLQRALRLVSEVKGIPEVVKVEARARRKVTTASFRPRRVREPAA
jgi:stearoyl-CoA desaturase (delta-9 desaturase)